MEPEQNEEYDKLLDEMINEDNEEENEDNEEDNKKVNEELKYFIGINNEEENEEENKSSQEENKIIKTGSSSGGNKKCLFVFRRDLRITDNTGLNYALKNYNTVYCIFILDPKQIDPKKNKYFSVTAFSFMLEGLVYLGSKIHLTILYGNPHEVISKLVKKFKIDDVIFNKDYTPYSTQRDKLIKNAITFDDIMINPPDKPYKVFTPYYNFYSKKKVKQPVNEKTKKIKKLQGIKSIDIEKIIQSLKPNKVIYGGSAKKVLSNFLILLHKNKKYIHDTLSVSTSNLSAYIKFGMISIREVYWSVENTDFRRGLYWRDFYLQLVYFNPNLLIDKKDLPTESYEYNISKNLYKRKFYWSNNEQHFKDWCKGKTGIPIVDACMNQLNTTGFLHNRGRLIVSNFLVRLLLIDWRRGEEYFAKKLVDYDPASNSGNWQYMTPIGTNSSGNRIYNPYTQMENHDSDCVYIQHWLPLMRTKTVNEILEIRSHLYNYEKLRERSKEKTGGSKK